MYLPIRFFGRLFQKRGASMQRKRAIFCHVIMSETPEGRCTDMGYNEIRTGYIYVRTAYNSLRFNHVER